MLNTGNLFSDLEKSKYIESIYSKLRPFFIKDYPYNHLSTKQSKLFY
jgi:hypothetical protein